MEAKLKSFSRWQRQVEKEEASASGRGQLEWKVAEGVKAGMISFKNSFWNRQCRQNCKQKFNKSTKVNKYNKNKSQQIKIIK
jgi:hypothetical protein